jgi:hypothetical protein
LTYQQTDRDTDRQTDRQTDRREAKFEWTDGWTYRQTDKQMNDTNYCPVHPVNKMALGQMLSGAEVTAPF